MQKRKICDNNVSERITQLEEELKQLKSKEECYSKSTLIIDDSLVEVHYLDEKRDVISYERWSNKEDKIYRANDLPAETWYDSDGNKIKEVWRINDVKHRDTLPAVIRRDSKSTNGIHKRYYQNGKLHRIGRYASKKEYEDCIVKEWRVHGKLYNPDGLVQKITYTNDDRIYDKTLIYHSKRDYAGNPTKIKTEHYNGC